MSQLKKLQTWINAYEKVNNSFPPPEALKFKIKDLISEEAVEKKRSFGRIHFRDSKWSDYDVLRKHLAEDKTFVQEFAGVDLKAYIEEALAWSEKGNTTTDNGWLLTLKNWMRKGKRDGRLLMKQITQKEKKGHTNY